jgi:predicted Zn-ribbon and HTH transcriptional regulator
LTKYWNEQELPNTLNEWINIIKTNITKYHHKQDINRIKKSDNSYQAYLLIKKECNNIINNNKYKHDEDKIKLKYYHQHYYLNYLQIIQNYYNIKPLILNNIIKILTKNNLYEFNGRINKKIKYCPYCKIEWSHPTYHMIYNCDKIINKQYFITDKIFDNYNIEQLILLVESNKLNL